MRIDATISAIVTGGASGLGRATALALAAAGAKVAIFDVDEKGGADLATEIGGIFCAVDVTDERSTTAGFAKARDAHGQERVLVHCAMATRRGKMLRYDKDAGEYSRMPTEDYLFSVNGILVASYRLASLSALGMTSLAPLADGERGVITLTASIAAEDGQAGQVAYGSAKAGVNGLVLPMARDLMGIGIRVNSIMPGIFDTPLLAKLPESVVEALNASVPFPKRLGKAEEFASLALELIRNGYLNGEALRLDGAIRMPPR